jgi:hypothetical protein
VRSRLLILIVGLALVAVAPAAAGGSEIGTSGVYSTNRDHSFVAWVPGASSTLVRTPNGISISLQTSSLPAGHAVTVWALIFNSPSACGAGGCDESHGDLGIPAMMGSVQHVAGHIVGTNGSFAGHLAIGDSAHAFVGPGLLNPFGAEIHLIVRDHGLADPAIITDQFNNDSPRFCNVACADIQKSVHLPDA